MLAANDLISLVGVSDLDRARAFYGEVLGLAVTDESPFAMVVDSNGTMLRLTAVHEPVPAPYSVLAWKVVDIEATVDELARRGIELIAYPGLEQDERLIWTAPNRTRIAWFLDPDGNNLSVVQFSS